MNRRNTKAILKALNTQYQFRADAIVPRASNDAPTIEQLGLIRDTHLHIADIIKELAESYKLVKEFRDSLMLYGIAVSTDGQDEAFRNLCECGKSADKYLGYTNEL